MFSSNKAVCCVSHLGKYASRFGLEADTDYSLQQHEQEIRNSRELLRHKYAIIKKEIILAYMRANLYKNNDLIKPLRVPGLR